MDGSINSQEDTRTKLEKRIQKTGHGGYGGTSMNKITNKKEYQFYEKINTTDPQLAELYGIAAALQLAEQYQTPPKQHHNTL